MLNYIKDIFNLEVDENIIVTGFRIENDKKIITVEYKLITVFCSKCGSKMHVKEKTKRMVKHNILQDGYQLIIEYVQRSWTCPNCKNPYTPEVSFVQKHKQFSNINIILPVKKLADLSRSVSSVAEDFFISDTQLHNIFLQHVDMQRLPLPTVISIDEVYTNFRDDCKYSLVIMDFFTHEIIDILPSRREIYTNKYFMSIPLEERKNVEYVISDMYEPYAKYIDRYFPNALLSIDSFHVIAWLLDKIHAYLRQLARKYEDKKDSDEYYLLKSHSWIMLKNEDNIKDIEKPKYIDRHFKYYVTTSAYREKFFNIDPALKKIHELKEDYIEFNNKSRENLDNIETELDELIFAYSNSKIEIFTQFSDLLTQKKQAILDSFIVMPSLGKTVRLSNGAMESFNRKPKDLKRLARGVENFEFFRQRILFSERSEKVLLATPKSFKEIQNKTNRTRGPYKKTQKN